MTKLNKMQQSVLKQIKKQPQGISSDELINLNGKSSGTIFILEQLQKDEYLSRLPSQGDRVREVMGLENIGNTGDWIITDKALAYLQNNKLESKSKLINRLIGFIFGAATTVLAQILLHIIL